jgi:hypothetical protein
MTRSRLVGLFILGATIGLGIGFFALAPPHVHARADAVALLSASQPPRVPRPPPQSPPTATASVGPTKPIPAIDVSLLPPAPSDTQANGTLRRPRPKPHPAARSKESDEEPATLDPAGIESLSKTLSKALDE